MCTTHRGELMDLIGKTGNLTCKSFPIKVLSCRQQNNRCDAAQFEGNYGAYIEDLKRRKGPDADMPTRIKYKKLVRS